MLFRSWGFSEKVIDQIFSEARFYSNVTLKKQAPEEKSHGDLRHEESNEDPHSGDLMGIIDMRRNDDPHSGDGKQRRLKARGRR